MSIDEIIRVVEALIVIAGVGSLFFVFFKSATTKTTIASQKDLIDTLSTQVKELRQLHIDNEKDIAELRGQVSVYKELPLADMSAAMQDLAKSQKEILRIIKKK